jgi:hypothetical protein
VLYPLSYRGVLLMILMEKGKGDILLFGKLIRSAARAEARFQA